MRNRLKKKHYKYLEYLYYNPDKYFIKYKKVTGAYPLISMGDFIYGVISSIISMEYKNKNKKWINKEWRNL